MQALSLQKGIWRGRSWEGEKAVPGRLPRVGFVRLVQERHRAGVADRVLIRFETLCASQRLCDLGAAVTLESLQLTSVNGRNEAMD